MQIEYQEVSECLKAIGEGIAPSMREEYKKRLLNNEVQYKRSILLTLRKVYPDIKDAEKAGFTFEMMRHAVIILRNAGYEVDLANARIEKK